MIPVFPESFQSQELNTLQVLDGPNVMLDAYKVALHGFRVALVGFRVTVGSRTWF